MALKKCDECGKKISTKVKTCPHCGAPNEELSKPPKLPKAKSKPVGCVPAFLFFGLLTFCAVYIYTATDGLNMGVPDNPNATGYTHQGGVQEEGTLRISVWDSTDASTSLSRNCRIWVRGIGDFYPARHRHWKGAGSMVGTQGDIMLVGDETPALYFYPYYTSENEGREIKVPFRLNKPGVSLKDKNHIFINVYPDRFEFEGVAIEYATGKYNHVVER